MILLYKQYNAKTSQQIYKLMIISFMWIFGLSLSVSILPAIISLSC